MAIRTVALLIILARLSCGVQHRLRKLGDLVELKSAMHPLNGSVFYRVSDPGTIVVVGLHYTKPGPDAFFWAGERRVNGGNSLSSIIEKYCPCWRFSRLCYFFFTSCRCEIYLGAVNFIRTLGNLRVFGILID